MGKPRRHVFDPALLQDLLFGVPNADGRLWVSYGTVLLDENLEGEEDRAVTFDEDVGPLVEVELQPSNQIVTCRVATAVSGVFEAEWSPLVGGDEVLVVIPEGSEQGPPCIIGRLNNALDKFPEKVAGKDARQNNLSFTRTQTPTIIESGSLYMIRSAKTGAVVGIDEEGNVTIRDGNATGFQFGPSGFALQDADGLGQFVLNTEENYASVWWQNTLLKMDGTDINIAASGNVAIGSAGNTPVLHAMASEQAVNLLVSYLQLLTATLSLIPAPLTGTALANIINPAGPGMGLITGAIALAGSNSAPTLGVALASLTASLQAPAPATPLTPGVGCPGFIIS